MGSSDQVEETDSKTKSEESAGEESSFDSSTVTDVDRRARKVKMSHMTTTSWALAQRSVGLRGRSVQVVSAAEVVRLARSLQEMSMLQSTERSEK